MVSRRQTSRENGNREVLIKDGKKTSDDRNKRSVDKRWKISGDKYFKTPLLKVSNRVMKKS